MSRWGCWRRRTGTAGELGEPGSTCARGGGVRPERGSDAPPLLLRAATALEPLDRKLARETYLGRLERGPVRRAARDGRHLVEVSRAAVAAPRPDRPPSPSICCWTAFPGCSQRDGRRRRHCWQRRRKRSRARRCRSRRFSLGWLAAAAVVVWDYEHLSRRRRSRGRAGPGSRCARGTRGRRQRARPGAGAGRRVREGGICGRRG